MPTTMHLYRGAPAVGHWSRYQGTIEKWSLCGVYDAGNLTGTEDPSAVNCAHCLRLMEASPRKHSSATEPTREREHM